MSTRRPSRSLDLKTGELFWPRQFDRLPRYPSLQGDIRCEVAIVGCGLTGAAVAHELTRAGLNVVVLDKRNVARGSTSASTAMVMYEVDVPLWKLILMRGRRDAVQSYRSCLDAIGQIEALAAGCGSEAEFTRRPSLYLASKPGHLANLRKEFKTRRRSGFNVDYLTATDLQQQFGLNAPGAILSADAAEVNPMALTFHLVHGSKVFGDTEVTRINEDRRGVLLRTDTGHEITARHVVVACGYETDPHITRRLVKLKSTYAMATSPVDFSNLSKTSSFRPLTADLGPTWPLIWETARPYCYLRTTSDNRFMIGGADEDFVDANKRDRLIKPKAHALHKRLRELFPGIHCQPAYAWAGTFGESKDGLPYIGTAKRSSRILYALCYGANGTNFAIIAANIIRDRLLGKRNRNVRLFALER